MTESYESAAIIVIAEQGAPSLRERMDRIVAQIEEQEGRLRRLHPEADTEPRRGPVATPWQTKRH